MKAPGVAPNTGSKDKDAGRGVAVLSVSRSF